ncbi:MAG: protein-glutamate O-methyltransferase CheR [Desulforegulaceae bacterium]|jgi:chemotaxis protein methyltransferase CheR|nr:protein-glutamate O-methyltransferase CheR [Desulforegulaceae bacterium]
MVKITSVEFSLFSKYILSISGISLDPGKEYLIETRLRPLLKEYNLSSFKDLYNLALNDAQKKIEKQIVDAISTNETYFFRDKSPFELLKYKILPDLIDKRTAEKTGRTLNIRVWSAASSTGQEIYSVAMIIHELGIANTKQYNIRLIGTDISDAAIAKASYGKYNKFEVARGLTPERLKKFFNKTGEDWRIKDEIRSMVSFQKVNLLKSFSTPGKFDIIFCRNVAIYFNPPDRKKLYQTISNSLEKDGYLLIGSTESLTNDTQMFKPQRYLNSTFYQFKGV